MSATLTDLRTDVAAALRLADADAIVHTSDPLTQFDREVWRQRLFVGDSIRCWYVESVAPSVAAQIGADDWTALVRCVGLYSYADGMQATVENYAQLAARRLRAIPYCRRVEPARVRVATIDDDRHVVYRAEADAVFYALVSLA